MHFLAKLQKCKSKQPAEA